MIKRANSLAVRDNSSTFACDRSIVNKPVDRTFIVRHIPSTTAPMVVPTIYLTRQNNLRNPLCGLRWIFVFPDPNDLPPHCFQPLIGVEITLSVGFDLFAPEIGVGLWPSTMLWTTMPKATIHEGRYTGTQESYICSTPWSFQHWIIHSIAQAHPMQPFPNPHLCRRVSLTGRRHATTGSLRRWTRPLAIRHPSQWRECSSLPFNTFSFSLAEILVRYIHPYVWICFERWRAPIRPEQRCRSFVQRE